jgi:hemolysin activation/secretion protein
MPARIGPALRHHTQMTITRSASPLRRFAKLRGAMLVIIAACPFASSSAPAASPSPPLTTLPVLASVVVEGSSAYQAPQFFATYSGTLGQPLTRDSSRAVAQSIAAMYVRDGFVKPEVTVDDALAPQGVLRVHVHEAQVSSVIIQGNSGGFLDELEAIGARLENARPLRRDDVPLALRAMRQYAGLNVAASTRRDPAIRNAFELVVQADFSPVDGVVRMNNRGTDQVGPAFLLGQLFANGLFGRGEKLGLIFAAANDHDEYLGGGLYFDTPLNVSGTRANALLFRSRSAPNESPVNLDDEYSRERLTLRLSHPLRQDSRFSLTASGAFEADDLVIDREGEAIRDDRLRVVETALRASWPAGAVQWSVNLQLRHGLDATGAGLRAWDLAHDPRRADFFATLAQASAFRRFADRWSLRVDAFAQTTGYVLPDSERFKIGGDRLGRGFEVAEIAGDRGLGGKIELRRDLLNTESFAGRLSTYGFYDIGAAWKQDRPGRESATTTGLGVALQGAALTGYLELAAPLTGTDIEGKRRASLFAELSYRF